MASSGISVISSNKRGFCLDVGYSEAEMNPMQSSFVSPPRRLL